MCAGIGIEQEILWCVHATKNHMRNILCRLRERYIYWAVVLKANAREGGERARLCNLYNIQLIYGC